MAGTLLAIFVYNWVNTDSVEKGEPAFEEELDVDELRRHPERLEEFEGVIQSVAIIRTPYADGGEGGGGANSSYESFAIDINDETHTIATGADWGEVEAPAQWLADELDVPYRDETYG